MSQDQKWRELLRKSHARKPLECLVYPSIIPNDWNDPRNQLDALKREWPKLVKECKKLDGEEVAKFRECFNTELEDFGNLLFVSHELPERVPIFERLSSPGKKQPFNFIAMLEEAKLVQFIRIDQVEL